MSLIASLLIFFSVFGVASHELQDVVRHCVHSQYIEPQLERLVETIESIPLETHRAANAYFNPVPARSLLQADEGEPIRIHIDYQLDSLPVAQANFMKERLMPEVKGVFQRALNVRKPVKGRFYLPYACVSSFIGYPSYCHEVGYECGTATHNRKFFGRGRTCIQPYDDQCTDLPEGEGVADADFILYVTAHADAGCLSSSETVASAGFCTYDMDNWYGLPGRPLAGVANFCPNNIYLEEDMFGYMLDTAVHEVLHALVMSKQLFERFIDAREQVRPNAVAEREGSLVVQTPAVVGAARSILGCPTMTFAKLEDEGGYGTADSHWERRLFIGEIMIGSSSASKRVVFSNLTLALAEDSGWYIPNYERSGVLSAIEHRGCGFVENDCGRYHQDLAETFCWNEQPADQQPAVCTPDHMAIGYCKNDMGLMGNCNIIQPFKNTHCTNAEHEPEAQHVDLGMRHKPNARCLPVDSYKISRTENYYTVYRSDLGAACFEVVCKGKDLYLTIPDTPHHKGRDIRCPTGELVDLTDYDLGFDEGTIGPCPKNDLLCETWGCLDDCNGNGMCFEGKCYCNIGYVGASCEDRPCPQNPCKEGEECQIETGECYPTGFAPRTPARLGQPQPEPTEPEAEESPSLQLYGPRPATSTPSPSKPKPPKKPRKDKDSASGEETPVPFTKPKRGPKTPRPLRSPVVEQAPEKAPPDVYDVPAYVPSGENFAGRAAAVGYLRGCLVFEDSRGDLRIRPETVRRYTKDFGEWAMEPFPKEDQLVVDPGVGQNCIDVFTDLRPLWRLRGFRTVRTLSGISTLAALTPRAKATNSTEVGGEAQFNEHSKYHLEQEILKSLGLKDKYILQRDFVMEAYATRDKEAKRAVVYNAMISNTVLQVSCFVDVSTQPSYQTSDRVFRILGRLLEGGLGLSKLVYTDTVYLLAVAVGNGDAENDRRSWLMSAGVAAANQLAYDTLSKFSKGIDVLDAMARLTYISQTKLCGLAAGLEAGDVDWTEFEDETSRHNLQKMADAASIPDVALVMRAGLESHEDPEREENLHLGIPYVNTEREETMFVGILAGILFISICMFLACCHRKKVYYQKHG